MVWESFLKTLYKDEQLCSRCHIVWNGIWAWSAVFFRYHFHSFENWLHLHIKLLTWNFVWGHNRKLEFLNPFLLHLYFFFQRGIVDQHLFYFGLRVWRTGGRAKTNVMIGVLHLKKHHLMHEPASTTVGEEVNNFERLGPMEGDIKRPILNFLMVLILVEFESGCRVGFGGISMRIIFELGNRRDISDF